MKLNLLQVYYQSYMYEEGRQGRHMTPLDSVLKAIRSQMQEKKLEKSTKKLKILVEFSYFLPHYCH